MYIRWMMPAECDTREKPQALTLSPATDILDDGESFHLILELPGVRQEDLELSLEKDHLLVRAERSQAVESAQLLHDGRHVQHAFERRFTIGQDVDREHVNARLENGLLHVRLPRRAEEKRRRIEVAVNERID